MDIEEYIRNIFLEETDDIHNASMQAHLSVENNEVPNNIAITHSNNDGNPIVNRPIFDYGVNYGHNQISPIFTR